jgi:hypothetical protein
MLNSSISDISNHLMSCGILMLKIFLECGATVHIFFRVGTYINKLKDDFYLIHLIRELISERYILTSKCYHPHEYELDFLQ